MAEPEKSTLIMLSDKHDTLFKLYALGYDDFRVVEKLKFFREFNWSSLHFVRNGKGHLFIGEKKYEIKKQAKGYYVVVDATVSDPKVVEEFGRVAKINTNVLRHLVIAK